MKKLPSVKINMLMNAILTMSSIVFPMISLPYVSRVLGPQNIGKAYFASSVVMFFAMLSELGIPVYGIRACARVRNDRAELSRTVQEIMIINIISCSVVYVLFALCVAFIPRLTEDRFLLVIMSSVIILNALGAEWLYKALEKYSYITIRTIIFKIAALAGMFILVRSGSDYVIYGYLTVFAASASDLINLINLRKYISLKPAGVYDLYKHLPSMMILFSLAAATTIYTSLDLAVLGLLTDDVQAGFYGIPVKIKLAAVSLITSISAVLLPRNSFYFEKGRMDEYRRLLSDAMTITMTAAVPMVVYFVVFAPECIWLLAGSEFEGSVIPMRIIMPSVILIALSNLIGIQMLIPQGNESETAKAAWIGAGTDLILNFLLIPRFGASGAAAATLTAELIVFLYLIRAEDRSGLSCDSSEDSGGCSLVRSLLSELPYRPVSLACLAALAASVWIKLIDATGIIKMAVSLVCFASVCIIIIVVYYRRRRT